MPRVNVEVESKFDAEAIKNLIKEASHEVSMKLMVSDLNEEMPKTVLLVGLLNGKPKGKVEVAIKNQR